MLHLQYLSLSFPSLFFPYSNGSHCGEVGDSAILCPQVRCWWLSNRSPGILLWWASTLTAHCYHQQAEHTRSVAMGICSILVLTLVVLCLLRETWSVLLFNFFSILVTGIYFSFEEISIAKECLIDNKKRKWCWWVLKWRFTVEVCSCLGSQFLFSQDFSLLNSVWM